MHLYLSFPFVEMTCYEQVGALLRVDRCHSILKSNKGAPIDIKYKILPVSEIWKIEDDDSYLPGGLSFKDFNQMWILLLDLYFIIFYSELTRSIH